ALAISQPPCRSALFALAVSLGPANFPQRLLENRTRLPPGNEMLAINNDRRHRVNPELLPELLRLPHLFTELPALEHLPRPLHRQSDLPRKLEQHVVRAGIAPVAVIGGKQSMLQRPLRARRTLPARPEQHPVRVERIEDTHPLAEPEP